MLTVQVEDLAEGLEEIKPLLPRHWEELGLNRDKVLLNPQYEVYLRKAYNGETLYVTLRAAGILVGYFVGFIAPALHYKDCLELHMDIFYLVPEERGQKGGFLLFRRVMAEAKRRGVQRMFVGNKEHAKVHATELFQALGFELVEQYYSFWLGD